MKMLAAYALMWLVPALIVLLLPWAVRKVRGPRPEPRMTDANFLVKMRLHNIMVDTRIMVPVMLISALVYLALGYEDGNWHLLFGGFWLGASLALAGRYGTCRQLVDILKKEEELST